MFRTIRFNVPSVMRLNCMFVVAVLTAATASAQSAAVQPAAAPAASPAPNTTGIAVPADFTIGPEDVVGVLFWRDTDMSADVTVRPDGMITLPLLGEVRAGGLTPEGLRELVKKEAGKIMEDPNITVVIRAINSRKVFISGQVTTPGSYPLIGPRTVLQLIAMAGGLTEYADSKNIRIVRTEQGKTTSVKFNYKDVSKGVNLDQNIQLKPGDTVIVP